jgi:hypothetical protein
MVKLVCFWPSRNLIRPEVEKLCAQLQKIDSGGRYHLKMSIVMLPVCFSSSSSLITTFERRCAYSSSTKKSIPSLTNHEINKPWRGAKLIYSNKKSISMKRLLLHPRHCNFLFNADEIFRLVQMHILRFSFCSV